MENMKNPTKRKDSKTDPTLSCFFTSVSQYIFFFFELHIKRSCVLMPLFIIISLILLAFTQ